MTRQLLAYGYVASAWILTTLFLVAVWSHNWIFIAGILAANILLRVSTLYGLKLHGDI